VNLKKKHIYRKRYPQKRRTNETYNGNKETKKRDIQRRQGDVQMRPTQKTKRRKKETYKRDKEMKK